MTTIAVASDHAALHAAGLAGAGLCTIVGIEGSFSRRLGAQLAVLPDGSITGSMADGCLERQLAQEIATGGARRVMRFGAGSPLIDFRLPCGSGLDILVDPAPDAAACRAALALLDGRTEAALGLGSAAGLLQQRRYMPALRLQIFGEGPELAALRDLAAAMGLAVDVRSINDPAMALGAKPQGLAADEWTAIVLLFHDHEWEQAILHWALESPAFFIGAQGGQAAREERSQRLTASGIVPAELARIRSPIGVVRHCREPVPLALSVLTQIVGEYEARHPHSGPAYSGPPPFSDPDG